MLNEYAIKALHAKMNQHRKFRKHLIMPKGYYEANDNYEVMMIA
jgi:hypothetical protein